MSFSTPKNEAYFKADFSPSKTIAFPKMFNSTSLRVIEGHDATYSNLRLLLLSDTTMLLGDPYYGTPLRQVIFSQNDGVVKDLAIDAIYTSILTFMP